EVLRRVLDARGRQGPRLLHVARTSGGCLDQSQVAAAPDGRDCLDARPSQVGSAPRTGRSRLPDGTSALHFSSAWVRPAAGPTLRLRVCIQSAAMNQLWKLLVVLGVVGAAVYWVRIGNGEAARSRKSSKHQPARHQLL